MAICFSVADKRKSDDDRGRMQLTIEALAYTRDELVATVMELLKTIKKGEATGCQMIGDNDTYGDFSLAGKQSPSRLCKSCKRDVPKPVLANGVCERCRESDRFAALRQAVEAGEYIE